MKRVLVLATNTSQASFRLRIGALIEPLRERGFDLQIQMRPRSLLGRCIYFRTLARDWHAIILSRKMLSVLEAGPLRRRVPRIVFDIDDAMMSAPNQSGPIWRWRMHSAMRATRRIVDHVVAGNNYLAEKFRSEHCEVTVLPTVVDPKQYRIKEHSNDHPPRLVWIGSHSTLPYLDQFRDAFAEAARRVAGLELVIIADRTLENPPLSTRLIPWSLAGESDALCAGDIGIAPTPENLWTIGKSGFKIVQYMAAGLPVIASPVGANRDIVAEGKTGILATSSNEWVDAIEKLAKDAELRASMGRAGRERVENEFSIDRAVEQWVKILQ